MLPRGACNSSLSQLTRNCTSLPLWAVISVRPLTISTRNTHGQVVSSVMGGSWVCGPGPVGAGGPFPGLGESNPGAVFCGTTGEGAPVPGRGVGLGGIPKAEG